MPVRSLPEPGSVSFTVVDVASDWTTPANAVTDIEESTGLDLSSPEHDTYFYLWEGEFDLNDLGVLKIAANGTATWEDTDGTAASFCSPPLTELAYILSIQIIAS
jgi:hypothetical protein